MNKEQIDRFEKLQSLINSMYEEIKTLSTKHPDDAINSFKLTLVNQTLSKANDLLSKKYLPFEDFDLFDNSKLPTNSDVVFILSSYLSSFEKLRSENITDALGEWLWVVDGKASGKLTRPPKNIQKE